MAETRRRGRFPEPGERVPLSFRVTPAFKQKIDQIAAASGKSIAQEIEQRLERSIAAEQHIEEALEMAYGPRLSGLILVIARAMRDTGVIAGSGATNWHRDPWAYDQAVRAATTILDHYRPDGQIIEYPVSGPTELSALKNEVGRGVASNLLRDISQENTAAAGLELKEWAARRRKQLGEP